MNCSKCGKELEKINNKSVFEFKGTKGDIECLECSPSDIGSIIMEWAKEVKYDNRRI